MMNLDNLDNLDNLTKDEKKPTAKSGFKSISF
jgi:hypothetical protein